MSDKSELKQEMDRLWYAAQHRLWTRCAVSGGAPVEIHHLITKSHLATSWARENGIGLTEDHHRLSAELSAHGTPRAFMAWLREKRPAMAAWVETNRERVEPSIYLNEKYEELKRWATKI